jgi:Fe2+ transport system protein B
MPGGNIFELCPDLVKNLCFSCSQDQNRSFETYRAIDVITTFWQLGILHVYLVPHIDILCPPQVNLPYLQRQTDLPVISISAKMGTNLQELLKAIKEVYDKNVKTEDEDSYVDCL